MSRAVLLRNQQLWQLLNASALDCDNMCALTGHLFYLLRPRSPAKFSIVGWGGGPLPAVQ